MKRFLLIATCALAVCSCVKEQMEPGSETASQTCFFDATREDFGGVGTKTVLRHDFSVDWLSTDNIGLFDGTDIARSNYTMVDAVAAAGWKLAYRFKAASYGKSSKFSYNYYSNDSESIKEYSLPEEKGKYLLIYPWGNNFIANPSVSEFRTWIDDDQTPSEGTFQANRGFAVARTDDLSNGVVFKNAVTLLEFEIPSEMDGKIVKVAVKGNASEVLAGDILIRYNDDETVTVGSWDDTYKSLEDKSAYKEVRLSASGDADLAAPLEAGRYYLVVMPQTLASGLTVTATDANGRTYVRRSDRKVELKAGYIYGMGAIKDDTYVTDGLSELPYAFSLYAAADEGNENLFVTSTNGKYDEQAGTVSHCYYDKLKNGVVFQCQAAGRTASDVRGTDFWSNKWGCDWIPEKSFVTKESAGEDFAESFYKLTVPLNMCLPDRFNVTFGLALWGGAIKDWKLQCSKDGETWNDGGNFSVWAKSDARAYIYNVPVTLNEKYLPGDTLYLRWIPVGNLSAKDYSQTTGWGSDCRFWGGVVITDLSEQETHLPVGEDVIYCETFDRMTGGVDYLMAGQADGTRRLGHLANAVGTQIADWTEEQSAGLTGEGVAMRPGYVQIGHSKPTAWYSGTQLYGVEVGSLVTPALAEGDLDLSFKALAYRSPLIGRPDDGTGNAKDYAGDATAIIVEVLGGGTIDGSSVKTIENVSVTVFSEYVLKIKGATSATRVKFTSPEGITDRYTRWFIDDICVVRSNEQTSDIKVMSFNISNSNDEDVSWNDTDPKTWTVRRHAVKSMLAAEKPVVIGMQEVTSVQYSDITGFGYGGYGVGRATGGADAESGEMCAIFYDVSQVTMGDRKGTFWLNSSGTVGEKGWDAAYVRIASWAEFTVKQTGKRFIFFNTHLDNSGTEARRNSVKLIVRKLEEINVDCLPVVITGDFNNISDHYIMDPFLDMSDNAREVAPETDDEYTYTAWDGSGAKVIDHIFSRGFAVKSYRTVTDRTYKGVGNFIFFETEVDCPYLSDHDPITAVLEL